MARARLPAATRDLEGTQPVLRHSPPILPFSMSTTGTPNAAAAAATERPPEPAPITQISGVRRSGISSPDDAYYYRSQFFTRHGRPPGQAKPSLVMPGLVPGIHVFFSSCELDVDGRDEPGRDGGADPARRWAEITRDPRAHARGRASARVAAAPTREQARARQAPPSRREARE